MLSLQRRVLPKSYLPEGCAGQREPQPTGRDERPKDSDSHPPQAAMVLSTPEQRAASRALQPLDA